MELFFMEKNPARIVSGMALGTDQWAVEVALKLDIKVVALMHRRNLEIVAQSSEIFAVWDGSKGGTKDCVKAAISEGLPITILDPRTMEFSKLGESNDVEY
jgi:uncharacterized phage-like protein YoqJ